MTGRRSAGRTLGAQELGLVAFGVRFRSSTALPGFVPDRGPDDAADVWLRRASRAEVEGAASAPRGVVWSTGFDDGHTFQVEACVAGDHVFRFGSLAVFHLSAQADVVTYCGGRPEGPWQRVLLDTVLFSTVLVRGFEALHASAVERDGGAILVIAGSGGGKSALAAEMIARGDRLLSDDVVVLDRQGEGIRAHPGPPLMNLSDDALERLGRRAAPVARFDRESWALVGGRASGPLPVRAVILLDRSRPDPAPTSMVRTARGAIELLRHVIFFAHLAGRERDRFELLSELAARAPVFRLSASSTVPVGVLADAVNAELGGPVAAGSSPAGRMPVLRLVAVHKRWPRQPQPVLDGAELEVAAGTACFIEGRNGAGKTTLLRIAAGLLRPDQGSVALSGLDPARDRVDYQRRLGFLSAASAGLYARLSVVDHLDLWARLALLSRPHRRAAVEHSLVAFDLEELGRRRVDRLSMGQRQRVRLAMALLHEPELVLLDEPHNSLDPEGAELLRAALVGHLGDGGAVVWCAPSREQTGIVFEQRLALVGGGLRPA